MSQRKIRDHPGRSEGANYVYLFLVGARDLSLLHSAQTGSGAQSDSYLMGTGGSFPRDEAAKREADQCPLHSVFRLRIRGPLSPFP
jgi:hypothetical protein